MAATVELELAAAAAQAAFRVSEVEVRGGSRVGHCCSGIGGGFQGRRRCCCHLCPVENDASKERWPRIRSKSQGGVTGSPNSGQSSQVFCAKYRSDCA